MVNTGTAKPRKKQGKPASSKRGKQNICAMTDSDGVKLEGDLGLVGTVLPVTGSSCSQMKEQRTGSVPSHGSSALEVQNEITRMVASVQLPSSQMANEMARMVASVRLPTSQLASEMARMVASVQLPNSRLANEMARMVASVRLPTSQLASEMARMVASVRLPDSLIASEMARMTASVRLPTSQLASEMARMVASVRLPDSLIASEMARMVASVQLPNSRLASEMARMTASIRFPICPLQDELALPHQPFAKRTQYYRSEGSASDVQIRAAESDWSDMILTGEISTAKGRSRAQEIAEFIGRERILGILGGTVQAVAVMATAGVMDPMELQVTNRGGATIIRVSSGAVMAIPCVPPCFTNSVIDSIREIGYKLEEHPSGLEKENEGELRDRVLTMLEVSRGLRGTAEAKRGEGKTDIRIVNLLDLREVLIVECKIWKGSDQYGEGIDQLLGYQTGREKSAVLLTFIKADHFGTVSTKAQQVVFGRADFVPGSIVPITVDSDIHCHDFQSAVKYSDSCHLQLSHLFFSIGWRSKPS